MPGPNIPSVSPFTLARASDINAISAAIAAFLPTFTQPVVALTSITVNHGFGWFPLVQVLNNTGTVVAPLSIQHADNLSFTVTFSAPFTGTVVYR